MKAADGASLFEITDTQGRNAGDPGCGAGVAAEPGTSRIAASDLESLLAEGHRARVVRAYVEQADLSGTYAGIKAVEGGSGRTPIAPEILFALWLYATTVGAVGSARAIARLTQAHDAYWWICGGVQVNYQTLSDFRTEHKAVFDGLLMASVAALLSVGAVQLKRVAPDGMRVRASAGASSFRQKHPERCLEKARAQVETLKRQTDEDPGAQTHRQQAARERARGDRQKRIEQALQRLPELEKLKTKQGKKKRLFHDRCRSHGHENG